MLLEICQLLFLPVDRFQLFKEAEFFPQFRKADTGIGLEGDLPSCHGPELLHIPL